MKNILKFYLIFIFSFPLFSQDLKVAVVENKPFSYFENGKYRGIAVDLWDKLAKDNGFQYNFFDGGENVEDAIDALSDGKFDLVIGNVSVTSERINKVDFSRPFFLNYFSVVFYNAPRFFKEVVESFVDEFALLLLLILFAFILMNYLYWFVEKRSFEKSLNKDKKKQSFAETLWLTSLTMFSGTVPTTPRTILGKVVVLCDLVLGMSLMASLAASFTNGLIESEARQTPFKRNSDISGKEFLVLRGSPAENVVKMMGGTPIVTEDEEKAYSKLVKSHGEINGLVEDYASSVSRKKIREKMNIFQSSLNLGNDEIAFALRPKLSIKRKIDQSLVRLQDDKVIEKICRSYLVFDRSRCVL